MRLEVRFSCPACGLKNQAVEVPARKKPPADPKSEESRIHLMKWMELVGSRVDAQHQMSSPKCKNKILDLMIPIDKHDPDTYIGAPVPDRYTVK